MGRQVTATVSDDDHDWINQLADDLDISNSKLVARCIRAVRNTENPHEVLEPWREAELTPMQLQAELQQLRARVAALEDSRGEIDPRGTRGPQTPAARRNNETSPSGEWVSQHADWSTAESAETPAKNDALADAYQRLQDEGSLTTPALVDVYDDHDLTIAQSTWRGEVLKVLATLPHVTSPGTGQSTWHYNDEE